MQPIPNLFMVPPLGIMGSVLYIIASRPDILFSVFLCDRHQSNPKRSHFMAVKRILRYIKHTIDYGLFYSKTCSFDLISYSNVDLPRCKSDKKSTSGTCHFLRHSLASWFSKK